MRFRRAAVALLLVLVADICGAAERQWQTGTWTDAGTKRTPWVADPTNRTGPYPGGPTKPPGMAEVGTYVLETADLRLELEDVVPLGSREPFERSVTIGAAVTFALSKNIAYIRNDDGTEYRLRVVKKRSKPRQSARGGDGRPKGLRYFRIASSAEARTSASSVLKGIGGRIFSTL